MNKLAEFPLARAGLADAPDDTVMVAWPGWSLTVGDVRAAQASRGSVSGIDLAELTRYDLDGEWEYKSIYPRSWGKYVKLADVQAALARATPQHPDKAAIQAVVELYGEALPADAATPQHSVTEQARVPDGWLLVQREPSQEQLNYAAYNMNRKRNGPDMVTAEFLRECWSNLLHSRPTLKSSAHLLPSTAATQPEQADDIRAAGWAVAVHNDYRLNGVANTFWLFTKGDRAVKGEGKTDAEALAQVRAALAIPASTAPKESK